jgi:hypothetical protein
MTGGKKVKILNVQGWSASFAPEQLHALKDFSTKYGPMLEVSPE